MTIASHQDTMKPSVAERKEPLSCVSCGNVYCYGNLVQAINRNLHNVTSLEISNTAKGIKKDLFYHLLWLPKYEFLMMCGEHKSNPFINNLKKLYTFLAKCYEVNSKPIHINDYPNELYLDETSLQTLNQIEWKVTKSGKNDGNEEKLHKKKKIIPDAEEGEQD